MKVRDEKQEFKAPTLQIDLAEHVNTGESTIDQCRMDWVERPGLYSINGTQLTREDFGASKDNIHKLPSKAEQLKALKTFWREKLLIPAGIKDEKAQEECIQYFSKHLHQGGYNFIVNSAVTFAAAKAGKTPVTHWITKCQPETPSNFIINNNQIIIEQNQTVDTLVCQLKNIKNLPVGQFDDVALIDVKNDHIQLKSKQTLSIDPNTGGIKHTLNYCRIETPSPFVTLENETKLDLRLAIAPEEYLKTFMHDFVALEKKFNSISQFEDSFQKMASYINLQAQISDLQQRAESLKNGYSDLPKEATLSIQKLNKLNERFPIEINKMFDDENNFKTIDVCTKDLAKSLGDPKKTFQDLLASEQLKAKIKERPGIASLFKAMSKNAKKNSTVSDNKADVDTDLNSINIKITNSFLALKETEVQDIIKKTNNALKMLEVAGPTVATPEKLSETVDKLLKACTPLIELYVDGITALGGNKKNDSFAETRKLLANTWNLLLETLGQPLNIKAIELMQKKMQQQNEPMIQPRNP